MDEHRCKRCGKHEPIPTHQYVKFDLEIMYVCKGCWDTFKAWFCKGQSLGIAA